MSMRKVKRKLSGSEVGLGRTVKSSGGEYAAAVLSCHGY